MVRIFCALFLLLLLPDLLMASALEEKLQTFFAAQKTRLNRDWGDLPEFRKQIADALVQREEHAKKAMQLGLHKTQAYRARLEIATERLLSDLYIEHLIDESTSEAKIKAFYESHKFWLGARQAELSHLVIKKESEAREVLADLQKKPSEFASAVRKYSVLSDRNQEGKIPTLVGSLEPDLRERAIFSAGKEGILPQLFKHELGFEILRIESRSISPAASYPQLRQVIAYHLADQVRKAHLPKI